MAEPSEQDPAGRASRADAVRAAVDQAFQATAGQANVTRERAQELVDELAQAAAGRVRGLNVEDPLVQVVGRLRDAVEDLRPSTAEEVRALRDEVRALELRVSRLEQERSG